jgi:hypothetical protein
MAQVTGLSLRWVQDIEQGRNGMTANNRLLMRMIELDPDAAEHAARTLQEEDDCRAERDAWE